MEKEKLIIFDETFFKKVTLQILESLKEVRFLILYDIFKDICENKERYNMSRDELASLIKSGKLIVETMPTLYKNVAIRDKIICLALMKTNEYDITVYTKDETLALDLILSGIKTRNVDRSNKFINIGKSQEKGDIYIYDTCALLKSMEKIDFSKNIHYFSTCVLEELFFHSSDEDPFFKFLYVYNEYPEHVKILNTVSSTQKGGRYSYTDLLILYSSIRSKNEFRDKNITLVTDDRQLYFEAMYLNMFGVSDKFDYFDGKSYVEEDTSGDIEDDKNNDVLNLDEETAEEVETDICNKEEEIPNDSSECNYVYATDENIVIDNSENILAHEEDDENVNTSLSKLLENTGLYNTVDEALDSEDSESSLDIEEEEENAMTLLSKLVESQILDAVSAEEDERPMSLEEKVVKVTNNYKNLPLKKLHRKNVVNLPEIIEHVYSSKFRLMTPVLRRKIEKGLTPETFIVKVGYYVTFKNKPTISYRVVSIDNLTATLAKI